MTQIITIPPPGEPGCALEHYVWQEIQRHKDCMVSFYLAFSYLWYNSPRKKLVSDRCYDWICERIVKEWYFLHHSNKMLVNVDYLTAHTGFYIIWDVPPLDVSPRALSINRVRMSAELLWDEWSGK